MSQRSQVANSGSSPIEACSAACAAPGQVARRRARRPRAAPAGSVHQTARGRRGSARAGRAAPRRAPRPTGTRRSQEGHDLVGHAHVAQADPGQPPGDVLALAGDLDVGDLAGRGASSPGRRAPTGRRRSLEVERAHEVGLALVEVDRALVHGAVRGRRRRRCRRAGRCPSSTSRTGRAAARADVGEVAGPAPVGPEPAVPRGAAAARPR